MPELRILLIDKTHQRVKFLSLSLNKPRYKISHLASLGMWLLKQVHEIQPDIIVIDIESPNRDMSDSLSTICDFNPKPVLMFSCEKDTDTIDQYIKYGVIAYVVGDLQAMRVKPILDAAVTRFREFQKLKVELSDIKHQLASRNLIDNAKRLLMKKKNLSEDNAFKAMRKTAMDTGQKFNDVAKILISFLNTV